MENSQRTNPSRSSSVTVAITQETSLLAPRTKALGLITILRIQETYSAAPRCQTGCQAASCPPDLGMLRLGKNETFTALPTAEIHDTAETKAEITITTAIGVLKRHPFRLYAQMLNCPVGYLLSCSSQLEY